MDMVSWLEPSSQNVSGTDGFSSSAHRYPHQLIRHVRILMSKTYRCLGHLLILVSIGLSPRHHVHYRSPGC
jgi:hypothetical protein